MGGVILSRQFFFSASLIGPINLSDLSVDLIELTLSVELLSTTFLLLTLAAVNEEVRTVAPKFYGVSQVRTSTHFAQQQPSLIRKIKSPKCGRYAIPYHGLFTLSLTSSTVV